MISQILYQFLPPFVSYLRLFCIKWIKPEFTESRSNNIWFANRIHRLPDQKISKILDSDSSNPFSFRDKEMLEKCATLNIRNWVVISRCQSGHRCRAIRDKVIYFSFRSNIWSALVPTAWSWRGNLRRGRGQFGSIETKEAAVWKFAQHSAKRSDPRINARKWTSQLNHQSADNSTSWFPLSITA